VTRARRLLWALGAPARALLIGLVRLYRLALSGWLGGQCRFYPSCSHYAEDAVRAHGAVRGTLMAAWRIARCGPFTDGGVDHVPPARHRGRAYETVIQTEAAS
jgi:putative membrane protein insertion efficiency factor